MGLEQQNFITMKLRQLFPLFTLTLIGALGYGFATQFNSEPISETAAKVYRWKAETGNWQYADIAPSSDSKNALVQQYHDEIKNLKQLRDKTGIMKDHPAFIEKTADSTESFLDSGMNRIKQIYQLATDAMNIEKTLQDRKDQFDQTLDEKS